MAKDIFKVDMEDQTRHGFDQIVLKDVIEHIHDPEKLIRRLKLFLRPGGIIFFGFPPGKCLMADISSYCAASLARYHIYISFQAGFTKDY